MACSDVPLQRSKTKWRKVNDIYVTNDIIAAKFFGPNATSKSLIYFQTKLGSNSLYYYNLDVAK